MSSPDDLAARLRRMLADLQRIADDLAAIRRRLLEREDSAEAPGADGPDLRVVR